MRRLRKCRNETDPPFKVETALASIVGALGCGVAVLWWFAK
jgi:hypothetical protein